MPVVWVNNTGYAFVDVAINISFAIRSVEPPMGSLQGGTNLTIRGYGFPDSPEGLRIFVRSPIRYWKYNRWNYMDTETECTIHSIGNGSLVCETDALGVRLGHSSLWFF